MSHSSFYKVEIRQHQDWHFATCEGLPGLFVAHSEHTAVLKNIPECIGMIIEYDSGEKVDVFEVKPSQPTLASCKTYIVTPRKAA